MHRQTLAALIGGKEYCHQTADLCCCSSCRDLGYVGYELLRQIVHDTVPHISSLTLAEQKSLASKLTHRIDEEERYRAGEYLGHLKEQDTTPQHCLCLLLAPFNDPDLNCECSHSRHDGAQVAPPPTMEQQHSSRNVNSDAWHDECYICFAADADEDDDDDDDDDAAPKTERAMMCSHCPRLAHKSCIAKCGNDVPPKKDDEWTCRICVLQHDVTRHDTRCLKCEQHVYIIDDLRAVCELALHDATHATVHGSTQAKAEALAAAKWSLAKLDSVDEDLLAYHAHLARDVNQDMFQKWAFLTVEQQKDAVTDLCDYWAKQGANKTKTATCEGMANIGVSCHGRMYTYANPSRAVRDDHPSVHWETYPVPPEDGGPALCREFRRSWSDSSKQDSYDTAATKQAEDAEFFAMHPWIKKSIGSMSDGASNYSSTSAAIYDLLSEHCSVKCISVEGEGKDNIDRDNGSEQAKLRAYRAAGDLTYSLEYIKACNARRHNGALNGRVEPDPSGKMTAEQKSKMKPIEHVLDFKLRGSRGDGSLVLWELFSRRLSEQAGRAVGYGRGRVISKAVLQQRHSYDLHKLSENAATIEYPETGALPDGAVARENPAPCLSRTQKSDAATAAEALKSQKQVSREARKSAAASKVQATFNGNVVRCDDCSAVFHRASSLEKHRAAQCGSRSVHVERRRVHDAGTVKSLVTLHDEDLADEAELAEEQGLDLITASFSSPFGWDLSEQPVGGVPTEFSGLSWATPVSPDDIIAGTRVRTPAARFGGTAAFDDFGPAWRDSFYYGVVKSRRGVQLQVEYPDGVYPVHFSHSQVGSTSADAAASSVGPAVVKSLDSVGAARRLLIHRDCVIVRVGGVDTPTCALAQQQLAASEPTAERPVVVVLRRPPPTAKTWRGAARSAANRRPPHQWHDDVMTFCDNLLQNPTLSRRSNAVYERLKHEFGHDVHADGRCALPPLKDVEARMLNVWKKKQKAARDAAQDSAAQALVQAVNDEGGVDEEEQQENLVITFPWEDGSEDTSTVAAAPRGSAGDGGTSADAHYGALGGVKVARLRELLRERGEAPLATVKQSDLPPDTPPSGPARSAAVLEILRRRLACVLAAAS